MMAVDINSLEIGELYVFHSSEKANKLWGIFEGVDYAGQIMLSVASIDFQRFQQHIVLPNDFYHIEAASRADIRDFAYNMGFSHI